MFVYLYLFLAPIYRFFVNLLWKIRGETVRFYFIDSGGNQINIDSPLTNLFLAIHYTQLGVRYKFVEVDPVTDTLRGLVSAFSTYTYVPALYSLIVKYKNSTMEVDPNEFSLVGNKLFTPTVNLWFCNHYLHVPPTEKLTFSYIDKYMNIITQTDPIQITEDGVVSIDSAEYEK